MIEMIVGYIGIGGSVLLFLYVSFVLYYYLFAGKIKLKVKKTRDDAIIPKYAYDDDSGFDLCVLDNMVVKKGNTAVIRHGIAVELPKGYEMQIRPRSSASLREGIVVHFGTIDNGYRGEIATIMSNYSDTPFLLSRNMKVSQGIIAPVAHATIVESDRLSATKREKNGYGSTGC